MKVSRLLVLPFFGFVVVLAINAYAYGDVDFYILEVSDRISRATNNAQLFLERGELYRERKNWKAAVADYDRAALLDPKLAAVEFCRGKLQADSGDLATARATFDRYLDANPKDVLAFIARARVLVKMGERKAGVDDFTRGIQLSAAPQPEYFIERAQAEVAENHLDDALRGLDEGVKRLGPIVTIQAVAIDLEMSRTNYVAALARVETILSAAARKESWLAKRGDIELLMNRPAESQQSYEAALAAVNALPLRYQKTQSMLSLKVRLKKLLAENASTPPGITNTLK